MTPPEVKGKSAGTGNTAYYQVKFNDSQNNKSKEIKIPIGSMIGRTNDSFEIKPDGIYQDGKKIEGNQIELTLPQMTAISVFAGDDATIDNTDVLRLGNTNVADTINDKLTKSGSEYYVHSVNDEDGSFSNAGVSSTGFGAIFTSKNGAPGSGESEFKEITIMTPEQLEIQKKEDEQQEKRQEAKLDKAYAEKHWFRNFVGITRQEYEKNNQRDY